MDLNRKMMVGWMLMCLSLTAVATGWWMTGDAAAATRSESVAAANDDMIRIHVIANSDSAEDQALKLKVRDAVMAELAPRLAGVSSVSEAEAALRESLAKLEETAGQVIDEQGFVYQVRAELGRFDFPGKSYGDLYLPAGEYTAFRLVIGEGAGANFWCLVYPSFCYRLYEVQVTPGGSTSPTDSDCNEEVW